MAADLSRWQLIRIGRDELIVTALAEALDSGDCRILVEVASAAVEILLRDLAANAEHFH